ncbi:MAG TPA: hypothetical protein VGP70_12555 [Actinomadura sp.]|jgi:anti-sigma factor RsiW|nr:hypothetical protein [Actinomadura sp.]
MSKERARLRAAHAAEAERHHEALAESRRREARWRERRRRLKNLWPARVRHARQGGIRARRHRTQNAGVLVLFLLVQSAAWLLFPSWTARLAVLLGSILITPVVVTLVFDRRT